jgi:hypothetical protein
MLSGEIWRESQSHKAVMCSPRLLPALSGKASMNEVIFGTHRAGGPLATGIDPRDIVVR